MSSAVPGSQAYQKWLNLSVVMRSIRENPGISRTELARSTGLTKSTVGNLVRELLSRRVLREHSLESPASSGRPRVGLDLPDGGFLIGGLDLRPEGYRVRVHDLAGRVIHAFSRRAGEAEGMGTSHGATPADPAGRFAVLLRGALADLIREAHAGGSRRLIGVGIALPATVDPFRGRILHSESFDLQKLSMREHLGEEPTLPLVIENDANALAWSALGRNRARRGRNLLAVTARLPESWNRRSPELQGRDDPAATPPSLNVGTGVVLDGSVYYGSDFNGGEFRSSPWRRGDPGETSGRGWPASRASAAGGSVAAEGAPRSPLDQALGELFESLAVLVSVLRPERLVYAGALVGLESRIVRLLHGELAGSSVDPAVSGCVVEPAAEGEYAVASGAADMFTERLFSLPGVDAPRPGEIPRWDDFPEESAALTGKPEVTA